MDNARSLCNGYARLFKQEKENYPTVSSINDAIDMDGIGNQGRVPMIKPKKRSRKTIRQKVG